MPNFTSSSESFYQGLSSFWTRLFNDGGIVKGLYGATSQLLGQSYLNLLETILSTSLTDTPTFHKEYWKLFTVRSDLLSFQNGTYSYALPDDIASFQFLFNKIYAPTVTLQNSFDFSIANGGVNFNTNPFTISGVPRRSLTITPTVKASGADGKVSGATFTSSSLSLSALNVGDTISLDSFSQPGNYTILSVNSPTSATLSATLTLESSLRWVLQSPSTVVELAFWISDASIDSNFLFNTYGTLVNQPAPSSESYRSLLRGVYQLYMLGASLERIEAALNAAAGYPLIQETEEIILQVGTTGITTDQNFYIINAALQKSTLTPGQILPAFSPLSNVFRVVDYIADPTWWWNIVIPAQLLPNESEARRTVSPTLYENRVNNPPGLVHAGDPGLFAGADDNGFIPAVTYDINGNVTSGRPPYRHLFAYTVMDRYLKYQMLGIFANPLGVSQSVFSTMIDTLVEDAKSSYIYIYAFRSNVSWLAEYRDDSSTVKYNAGAISPSNQFTFLSGGANADLL